MIFESWFKFLSKYESLYSFNCNCFITILPAYQQDKLAKRAHQDIFIGYEKIKLNDYRAYNLEDNKLVIIRDIQFDELNFDNAQILRQLEKDKIELDFLRFE